MHLLLVITPDQRPYLPRFSTLGVLIGHKISVMADCPSTASELSLSCTKAGVEGILCANQELLEKILDATPDFKRPNNRRGLTLDDYQGSFLSLRRFSDGGKIPVVVLNPPEHMMTVPYGAFMFTKFIKKITAPEIWFKTTKFEWGIANESEIAAQYERFKSARFIAVDIETPLDNPDLLISCISFTGYWVDGHRSFSLVIPFTSLFWLTWIRKFCALPAPKIFQGGTYDNPYLLRFNCPVFNWLFDTLNLFHSWYSEMPKRLDFVSAFSIREVRYWKDDGKSGNLEDYYRYNGMDGWATLNSFLALVSELPDWAIRNYLEEFPLNFPSIHCDLEGWKVDKERFFKVKAEKLAAADAKLTSIRKMLKAPNFNPRSSPQKLKLLKILGCDFDSADAAHLNRAAFAHPLNARIIDEIKDYIKTTKLLSTYLVEEKFLRWRLHYRINFSGTDTGRPSCSESSFWFGFQIQNVPRGDSIKQFLVADQGWLLAEPDFTQSEARCMGAFSGDRKLIEIFESGRDFHSVNVQHFFGVPYSEVWDEAKQEIKTKLARELRNDITKRVVYGGNYNMKENTLIDTMTPKYVARAKILLKLNPFWGLRDVTKYLLRRYFDTYKNIEGVYYPAVVLEVETTNKLTSPLGHVRWCFGDPKNHHYFRSMVAHKPQNLSAHIMNKGFYRVWWEQIYGKFQNVIRIKAHIHDSLPYQFRIGADWVNEEVRKILTRTVEILGADKVKRQLTIPVGMSAGKERWSELK